MKESDLPSPKLGALGFHLRRVAANAISYIQVNAKHYTAGTHPQADDLIAFFQACAAKVDAVSSPSTSDGQ